MSKLIKKCFEILQEKEKVVSTPLIQMFSQLIIVKLCHFHYFQIQCFAGSFLIENIFLFIIISANLLTGILKYLNYG